MAVDSAQKRFSLLGLGSPVPRLLPIPQGTLAADDRALLIFLYSGLTAAADETPSGGWPRGRPAPTPFRDETETERDARIKAERIRMGILPQPNGPEPLGLSTGAAPIVNPNAPSYSLAALLLPEDLAGLEALAARAAELRMDEEIALWLRLDEQRRAHEAWLRDEDDVAVLLLAIATIH